MTEAATVAPVAAAAPDVDLNLLNAVVRQKKALKQQLDAEAAAHKVRQDKYKAQIKGIDEVLLRVLDPERMPTYRSTDAGTIGITESRHFNVSDRPTFDAWVRAEGDMSYFTNALAKKVVMAYVEEYGDLPPGVTSYAERKITHNTTTT